MNIKALWGHIRSSVANEEPRSQEWEPTIDISAMNAESRAMRRIGDAVCVRLWETTQCRNKGGRAHINETEMDLLLGRVEAAAAEVIRDWDHPEGGGAADCER